MPRKPRGRPISDDSKTLRVDVRLTEEELRLLDQYCKEKEVSRPQGLRDGIYALNKK